MDPTRQFAAIAAKDAKLGEIAASRSALYRRRGGLGGAEEMARTLDDVLARRTAALCS